MIRYRQGWQALNRLLHEDRSFSGNEKHNVFLNCGSARYADISAVSGLDFPEDGRAIAPVDWDFDGDLDLWITNRTAPRVRFMANQGSGDGSFLTLSLEGGGGRTNRDAIGARVSLTLADGTQLLRTKYAGESFLSKGSDWLHFGLGSQTDPVDITVRWPGGSEERFSKVTPNAFYVLRQGTGTAAAWSPPGQAIDFSQAGTALERPPAESGARIVLSSGLAFPPLEDVEGRSIALPQKTTLVNLWASWCRPCLEELAAWTQAAETFRQAGVEVLALNVDEDAEGRAKADALREKLKVPFAHRALAPQGVRSLDLVQRAVLDRWEAMPVPSSFLVDAQGFILAIYKGPTEAERIVADARELVGMDPAARRMAAVPFPGVWTHDPPLPDPLYVTTQFVDYNLIEEAKAYLKHATTLDQRLRSDRFSNTTFADRYLVMATLLNEQDLPEEAIAAYRTARDLNPRDLRIRLDLGDLLQRQNRIAEAITEWESGLTINPKDLTVPQRLALAHLKLDQPGNALKHLQHLVRAAPRNAHYRYYIGTAFQKAGYYPQALAAFRDAAKLNPNLLHAPNHIAWIRATHPDEGLRDGTEAVRLAEGICQRSGNRNPNWLETLSAAYAESGDFTQALETVDRALALLEQAPASAEIAATVKKLNERRALFEASKPFRDASLKPAAR